MKIMWYCDICKKNEVKDKGKGFRFFAEYNVLSVIDCRTEDRERISAYGNCRMQIRLCEECLKINYQTLKI